MVNNAVPDSIADYIRGYKAESLRVLDQISEADLVQFVALLGQARSAGNQVFVCGNGGSASTASHLANDLGKGASLGREQRFRVLALTDNISWITALANDMDYSKIFLEQLKNYAQPGDLLVVLSGSGNSPNVLEAVGWANENQMYTIGLTGSSGELGRLAQHTIRVDSTHMGHIEEAHFLIQHLISYFFMEADSL